MSLEQQNIAAFPREHYTGAKREEREGMTLLDYHAAHAPANPPEWWQPNMRAKPNGMLIARLHFTEEKRQLGNRRNSKMQKQVQTPLGEITVSTPRDRNSSFEPQFIKKRETILAEGVADRIIGLYALGNSIFICMGKLQHWHWR